MQATPFRGLPYSCVPSMGKALCSLLAKLLAYICLEKRCCFLPVVCFSVSLYAAFISPNTNWVDRE